MSEGNKAKRLMGLKAQVFVESVISEGSILMGRVLNNMFNAARQPHC